MKLPICSIMAVAQAINCIQGSDFSIYKEIGAVLMQSLKIYCLEMKVLSPCFLCWWVNT